MSKSQYVGTVKWFNENKGYGFINCPEITRDGNQVDVFVHYKHVLMDGFKTLCQNELVEFEPVQTSKGIMATKIKRVSQ